MKFNKLITNLGILVAMLLAATVILTGVGFVGLLVFKASFQSDATEFWGDSADGGAEGPQMEGGMLWLIPKGGPLINAPTFGTCLTSPLPLLPVRASHSGIEGAVDVLCSSGKIQTAYPTPGETSKVSVVADGKTTEFEIEPALVDLLREVTESMAGKVQ